MTEGQAHRTYCLIGVFLVGMLLAACGRGGATPTKVAELEADSQVRRASAVVWAGPDNVSVLPRLDDSAWHALSAGSLVTTDASGEGWISISDCMLIYVFQSSGLVKAACPKSDYTGGNVTCAIEGTSVYNNDCAGQIIIQTLSAEVELQGTWLSVTYLPERQLTLVMVFEGEATVQPVLDFDARTLGNPIDVEEGHFWFTTPGDTGERVAGLDAREPHPFDRLPPLIDELDLAPWIDRIRVRADGDQVPFPEFPPSASAEVFLQGGGGALENEAVQQAVLRAVPWAGLTEELFPGQDVPVTTALPGVEIDAREVEHNPDLARELLTRAGFPNGFGLVLLYAPGDDEIAAMAGVVVDSLREVGIQVKSGAVSAAEAPDVLREIVLGGDAALWLGRELLEVDLSASPAETRDETPPAIGRPDVSPAAPTTDDRVTITVAARDAESGVGRIEIYVSEKLVQRCTGAKCSVTLGPFSRAGEVGVQVLAYDQAGNQASREGTFSVSAVSAGQPDLAVAALETTGSLTVNPDGNVEVPIRVVVINQGDADADVFKVATQYTGPQGTFVVPFTVPGQGDQWYPRTNAPLAAGRSGSVTFSGKVTFLSAVRGTIVSLQAIADSCSGDEFMPEFCRVEESNEDNNDSEFITVSLVGGLLLRSGGGAFKDPRVQTAVLHAAPWAAMVDEVFGDPNLPVMTELDGQQIDARKMEHNPDLALEMMAKAGYPDGFGVTLLVPQGDEQLAAMGDWLASILGEVGIDAGFNEVPAADASDTMAKLLAAGEPVLWLSRQ